MHALVTNQSISNFFLLILAFTPVGWVAALLYLLRDLFMKTGSPIFESFYLENVGEHERGMMSSIVRFAFTGGSAIGPYVSGWVQNRAGFSPLFFIMLGFYGVSTFLLWLFFWNFER
jgi:fucose permease